METVLRSDEVEYAGFVEIDPALAQQRAREYGFDPALFFPSVEAALDAVKPDGLIDVTPPGAHKNVSLAALDAGIPVLSEKPLAGTREDAQAIVDKANATGVLHMVAQNRRYTPLAQTVRQVLASGELGVVGAVEVEFYKGPHFGGYRQEMPYPLIVDMSIHHFDMMRFFLGSNAVSVFGRSWNPPWSWYAGDASASVVATFDNGAEVNYTGSWCSRAFETSWEAHWRFECENGVMTVANDVVQVQTYTGVEDRPGYRHVTNSPARVVPLVEMQRQAQVYLLHEFHQAVTAGQQPATICQDNIHTVNFVFDVVRSFETGSVVQARQNA